jgi:hypothetical protein
MNSASSALEFPQILRTVRITDPSSGKPGGEVSIGQVRATCRLEDNSMFVATWVSSGKVETFIGTKGHGFCRSKGLTPTDQPVKLTYLK